MKFACILVTRGNPERASAVIESARALASGENDIRFIVCCDSDDESTIKRFDGRVELSIGAPPMVLGEVWNRGAALCPEADVICPLADDSFIAAPDWDQIIKAAFDHIPHELCVIGWNDTANPGLCTLPIVSRAWYDAAGLYVGWFPYWFYDTWLAEVYSFVSGSHPILPTQLLLAAKKGKTQRMRDLGFWWRFYSATRPDRLKEAARLREKFGIVTDNSRIAAMVRDWETRDEYMMARIEGMEAAMADTQAQMPSERYLAVKAKAGAWLADARQARPGDQR